MSDTIDSNITGLRIAEETTIGVLPGTPIWDPHEPNSYTDFGGQITTISRTPIEDTRQRKKGVVTDLDASGGFETDFTQDNLIDLLAGVFMRDWIEKPVTKSRNAAQVVLTAITTTPDEYVTAGSFVTAGFVANHLIFAEDNNDAANNGLKTVTSVSATNIAVAETLVADGAPAADSQLTAVGYEFDVGTVDVAAPGGAFTSLTRASGVVDWTTIGLSPGDWIWIGGDAVASAFDGANNNGAARVFSVAEDEIVLDKTDGTQTVEAGADESIQIFFAHRINNATVTGDFTRRTFQLERTLGSDGVGTQSEYLVGGVPNQMTINIPQADKVIMELAFIALDHEQRTGTTGVKPGTRPTLADRDAFNTSSDFNRLKMNIVSTVDSNPTALFAFLTELTITHNNNVTANKAIAVLGAFEANTGVLEVGSTATAYFSTIAAIQAVRNNESVTIDWMLAKNNSGWVLDLPLVTLGDGRPNIELNQPVTLPLNIDAAKDAGLLYTIAMHEFKYLPTVAE